MEKKYIKLKKKNYKKNKQKIAIKKNNIAIRIAGKVSRYIDASMNRATPNRNLLSFSIPNSLNYARRHWDLFCSVVYSAGRLIVGLSLDIRRRNNAKGACPCLCHAAPPTAVGGAHNSPIANATVILKSGLVHYRLHYI